MSERKEFGIEEKEKVKIFYQLWYGIRMDE